MTNTSNTTTNNTSSFYTSINGGSTQISGLSSGINSQQIIDALVSARRAPAVKLEDNISKNNDKLTALGDLKSKVTDLTTALSTLRGDVGYFSKSVFDNKVSYATSALNGSAAPGQVASSADSILGASVANNAQVGKHVIEVTALAKANQLRTDAVTSKTDSLQSQGVATGTFTLNGKTITIGADDSLTDLRNQINLSDSGVTASIVSASSTQHYLVLTSSDTGTVNTIDFAGGTAVSDALGLTTGGAVKNELQAAADAVIRVDNLGVDIVRSSNTIDDVIEGVTLDIYKAEPGTDVNLEVSNDLGAVKDAITSMVDAFNALKDFSDDQRAQKSRSDGADPTYGPLAFDTTLRSLVSQLNSLVGATVAGQPAGYASLGQLGITMDANYHLTVNDDTLNNKLLTDVRSVQKLFEFNFTSSDSRVTLGSFDGTAVGATDVNGDPAPYYLNIGATDASGNVTSANLQTTAGTGTGGASDGTISASGKILTVLDASPAAGLKLIYTGGASVPAANDISITFSRGIADQLFQVLDRFQSDSGTGIISQNEQSLQKQNDDYNKRIADIDARIALYRQQLQSRFAAMEQAVQTANNLKQSITSAFQASNSSNNGQ